MLPLSKKTSDKVAVFLNPAWHPNFRNTAQLPDIKVVRTAFFINGIAILVVLILGFYLAENIISLRSLRDQTINWQQRIDREKPGSDQGVLQFKKFQEEEKKLSELKQFQGAKIVGSELLLQFGESLPPRVTLNSITFNGANIVVTGAISGSPDDASGDASAYLDSLGKFPYFAARCTTISLTGINRNPATSGISFEILLVLKPDFQEAKK